MKIIGQYYLIIDIDRLEYLKPHKFNDGAKLMEFALSSCGTMSALAILLASGNGRGGGDIDSKNPIVGSWAGDRIVIAGDYDDPDKFAKEILGDKNFGTYTNSAQPLENHEFNLCGWIQANGKDITEEILEAMMDDEYLKDKLKKNLHSIYGDPEFDKWLRKKGIITYPP